MRIMVGIDKNRDTANIASIFHGQKKLAT